MHLALRIKVCSLLFSVMLVSSGLNCPTLVDDVFDPNSGMVTLRLENQSGFKVKVITEFILEEFNVRETVRRLEPSGPDSTTTLLPTRARLLTVLAEVSEDAELPANARVEPGDVLAEGRFELEIDFNDGDTILFVILGPPPPPTDIIDCNDNDISDVLDIANGTSQDCNGNGIPDECETDCNGNGIPDDCDLASGYSQDCNDNGIPDECDIASGFSEDCNGNGIPDECDVESAQPRLALTRGGPNLLFPLDTSTSTALSRSDDGSSNEIPLGFTFDLFGTEYTSVYINNNGNLTFGTPFSAFNPEGFPRGQPPMIAPFWADVDMRGLRLGRAWYKIENNTLIVTWNRVGYYFRNSDKRNTFQVAISDGNNPTMGIGNNVIFSYADMQWTTGDASGGVNGFGGIPATVGINAGNGVDSFQIGRFDKSGTDYDGPYGENDGVDFLDGQVFYFNTASQPQNLPPIVAGLPPGGFVRLNPSLGDTLDMNLRFHSPELDQTTTVQIDDEDDAGARGLTLLNTPGNVAEVYLAWSPTCDDAGLYAITMTASDDFVPPGVTTVSLSILVSCLSPDCNGNGIPDECDIASGFSEDCNENGIPDECDIASGFSEDEDEDGIPDECEIPSVLSEDEPPPIKLEADTTIDDDFTEGEGVP